MGSKTGLVGAMLAGMAGGAFVMQVVHAQTEPPVYFVGEIDVTNPEGYAKEYLPKAREIIKAHGGQLIAAGGAGGAGNQVVPVDGEPPKRVVIYRYPSTAAVYAWRHDPAYEEVRKIGEKYAKYRTFAVEGIAKQGRD
ncbi:MAG TPA: DUF1330 domain-containing protein [Acetobacteraceae bacterium]|nr:DUF1330 domain-containing protein [Acetobacteraceae bacterium]